MYRTLLMDPPWNERGCGKVKRGADRHYPLLKTREIAAVIRESGKWQPAEHAHLWMWATNNKLPDALWLGAELGFEYKSNVAWAKMYDPSAAYDELDLDDERYRDDPTTLVDDVISLCRLQVGLGQYLRGSHELLLLFVRGKGQAPEVWNGHRDVRSVVRARRTTHSTKPEQSYTLIERVSKGPRVEFFARSTRPGWDVWGNEVTE